MVWGTTAAAGCSAEVVARTSSIVVMEVTEEESAKMHEAVKIKIENRKADWDEKKIKT